MQHLEDGDILLLRSDGLSDRVDDDTIAATLATDLPASPSPSRPCSTIRQATAPIHASSWVRSVMLLQTVRDACMAAYGKIKLRS